MIWACKLSTTSSFLAKLSANSKSLLICFSIKGLFKDKYELKNKDNYRKYKHSIEIKKEAAMKIGIDNIRNSKLKALDKELIEIKKDYEDKKGLVPILLPVFIAELVK